MTSEIGVTTFGEVHRQACRLPEHRTVWTERTEPRMSFKAVR
jgi:hypothetical protein